MIIGYTKKQPGSAVVQKAGPDFQPSELKRLPGYINKRKPSKTFSLRAELTDEVTMRPDDWTDGKKVSGSIKKSC